MDNILAEHLKNRQIEELSKDISELLNETAKNGFYPKEIKLGQLTPLQESVASLVLMHRLHSQNFS